MRLLSIFLALALLALIPFLIWGERFEIIFSREGSVTWLAGHGHWAWAAGMALLVLDVFLPLPSTVIMSALGMIYGILWGGLIAAAGSFLAGMTAYGLCRVLGLAAARRLAGEKALADGRHLFERAGGWMVALSRCLPLLAEVIACMAGLTAMPLRAFALALVCGCLPTGFVFAAVGHTGHARPALAIALSLLVPCFLWLLAGFLLKRKREGL